MFGWINDCTECLVISKFGEGTWHDIKKKAGCNVADGGFLRYKYYPDSDTVELVVAASEVIGISVDDVLHDFGDYFIDYVKDNGYSNVLECLGSNMRDWLSNLNSLHDHLQASYPKGFVAPVFWSEDDVNAPSVSFVTGLTNQPDHSSAILVHYYSQRGSLLVPLVVGVLKKLARDYFDIEINVDQLQLQDEEQGINDTTLRVTTKNPAESYKLRGKKKRSHRHSDTDGSTDTTAAATSNYKYPQTFREDGTPAANLRVDEFVMRSFYNEDCELFHALTLEQYLFLIDYWKTNQMDGKWCFEIWSIQDDDPKSWAKLSDLPSRLNPESIDGAHFGGMVPETGRFPPDERGILLSFPPKVRVVNGASEKSIDLTLVKSSDIWLEDAIYCSPEVETSQLKLFSGDVQKQLDNDEMELQCVVWDEETESAYHTFSLGDLKTTSTLQLYELVPKSFDPIRIVIQCAEVVGVDDDEEDL
jgi:hypothetical protein